MRMQVALTALAIVSVWYPESTGQSAEDGAENLRTEVYDADVFTVAGDEVARAIIRFDEAEILRQSGNHGDGLRAYRESRQTYLEIEPSDTHDSRLTAAEIASLPIDAELVALAACDTGAAEALLSDERLDLTRAFLVAGAAAVLATRWKVPEDYRTSRFLVDFYRAYRQGDPDGRGMRKDQALTEARRLSCGRDDPAQVWAAWVLVGDGR